MAYRFVSHLKGTYKIETEFADFNFAQDWNMWVPYVRRNLTDLNTQKFNSFENTYEYLPISKWNKARLAFLPLMVDGPSGKKIVVTESDLLDYPGMYLYNYGTSSVLEGNYAEVPKEVVQGGHNNLQMIVQSREEYIAKFDGPVSFPWRIVAVSENDVQMADNDLVWKLATPAADKDWSWVKPGKVAWDWWNDWNIYGVDFRAGINNDTYKYYIDFASKNGIEYVILDEGWAVNKQADLFQVIPEINLPELVAYGKSRNVGLILWAGYWAFERDMERVCKHYSEMGIKGFKVDFMDRDDQVMVDFYTRAAEMAAQYGLLIDYHGAYKPTGLHRTYPNVINFEGVFGLEQMKWSKEDVDMVTYDVTVPYIRMMAGPMDYTQGSMRNAVRKNYRPVNTEAMSQGTRCRQLAEYIVFDSPLNMLCDSPSNYMREQECTDFISAVPTVWDETVGVDGEVGKYIVMARRSGDLWYVGAMTDWNARQMNINLDFVPEGDYVIEFFSDGINADRAACDYKREMVDLPADRKINVKMAPGGGYAAKIYKK
jgi:alpha-glucosidase